MEACFSQLTLDVIGKSVFSYDFGALTTSSPVIQVPIGPSLNMVSKTIYPGSVHGLYVVCSRYRMKL